MCASGLKKKPKSYEKKIYYSDPFFFIPKTSLTHQNLILGLFLISRFNPMRITNTVHVILVKKKKTHEK